MIIGMEYARLTKTELRIVELLEDGQLHSKEELIKKCLPDDMGDHGNISFHICRLRAKLPRGLLILHVSTNGKRGKGYQMARALRSSYE